MPLVGVGLVGYWLVGPPSAMEAEVTLDRRPWGVTTEAERARIQERLQAGRPAGRRPGCRPGARP